MRRTVLDEEVGSLYDPVGSKGWVYAALGKLRISLDSLDDDAGRVRKWLHELQEHQAWRVLDYDSLEKLVEEKAKLPPEQTKAFLDAKPGQTVRDIRALATKAEPLRKQGRPSKVKDVMELAESAIPLKQHGKVTNGNIKPTSKLGPNSQDYLTRRIARDRPDILEEMKEGKYKSVRQAAIAAGIVKVPTAFERICKLLPKLSEDEVIQLEKLISEKRRNEHG